MVTRLLKLSLAVISHKDFYRALCSMPEGTSGMSEGASSAVVRLEGNHRTSSDSVSDRRCLGVARRLARSCEVEARTMRDVGRLGEADLVRWCNQADLIVNQSRDHDASGWDYLVEWPPPKTQPGSLLSLDRAPASLQAFVQVKATDGKERRRSVALTNCGVAPAIPDQSWLNGNQRSHPRSPRTRRRARVETRVQVEERGRHAAA